MSTLATLSTSWMPPPKTWMTFEDVIPEVNRRATAGLENEIDRTVCTKCSTKLSDGVTICPRCKRIRNVNDGPNKSQQDRELPKDSNEDTVAATRVLLEKKIMDACADKDAKTPLHLAAFEGHLQVVEFLLKVHFDPNAADKNGETPLHKASNKGQLEVVQFLLKAGVDAWATNKEGITALHLASLWGHEKITDSLLKAKANPNAANKYGETPLHWASREGYGGLVESLLKAGARPNATDQLGQTPLHVACNFHKSDIVRLLLASGADPHTKDRDRLEPLHLCIQLNQGASDGEDVKVNNETLLVLQSLVSLGVTWDATCDEIVESGMAWKEALALRLCILRWAQEHANGLEFSVISMDVIRKVVKDIQELSPDGGLCVPCNQRIRCGHSCPWLWHTDDEHRHEVAICHQPCVKRVDACGHSCQERCHEVCHCREIVGTYELPCGHSLQNVKCADVHSGASTLKCRTKVQVRLPFCGHVRDVRCPEAKALSLAIHQDDWAAAWTLNVQCDAACGGPQDCGHACEHDCGLCLASNLVGSVDAVVRKDMDEAAARMKRGDHHVAACCHACERQLLCGHTCASECHATSECPPCDPPCRTNFVHSKASCEWPTIASTGSASKNEPVVSGWTIRGRDKRVMYHIDVRASDNHFQEYSVRRSYNDFKHLHGNLSEILETRREHYMQRKAAALANDTTTTRHSQSFSKSAQLQHTAEDGVDGSSVGVTTSNNTNINRCASQEFDAAQAAALTDDFNEAWYLTFTLPPLPSAGFLSYWKRHDYRHLQNRCEMFQEILRAANEHPNLRDCYAMRLFLCIPPPRLDLEYGPRERKKPARELSLNSSAHPTLISE